MRSELCVYAFKAKLAVLYGLDVGTTGDCYRGCRMPLRKIPFPKKMKTS